MPTPRRWRFLNPKLDADRRELEETHQAMDSWWSEFQRRVPDLNAYFDGKHDWDLADWMGHHLTTIRPEIMWEYGPAVRGDGHRLVITPEHERHLRPVVASLLERAPQIPGWEFYGYRLPDEVEQARQMVKARTGGDISDTVVSVHAGSYNCVDLMFHDPATQGEDDRQAYDNAFVATETLLGEELLDRWVGVIEVARLTAAEQAQGRWFGTDEGAVDLLPLGSMRKAVQAHMRRVRDESPSSPCHERTEESEWCSLELKPTEDEDYVFQDDLLFANTAWLDLWDAQHRDPTFYDNRYSRHGETFAYLKLDAAGSDFDLDRRNAVSDALIAKLEPPGLGTHMGGGTGLRYLYVDLALTDVDRALPHILEILRQSNVPKRTWLQFYDAYWKAEWVSIYDESPSPPMPELDEN